MIIMPRRLLHPMLTTPRLLVSIVIFTLCLASMSSMVSIVSPSPNMTKNDTDYAVTHSVVYATDRAQAIYNSVSYTNIISLVHELSDMGPRPRGSDVNQQAREWIINRLNEYTNNTVEISIVGERNKNILARLPGTGTANESRVVMIGGHYDSVSVSPGANDNGIGVVTALELARVLSRYSWPLDIIFCFWDGEELGLLGSSEVADMFASDRVDILVYFNIDMLLVQDPYAPVDERVWMVYNNAAGAVYQDAHFWADLTRAMSNNYHRALIYPMDYSQFSYWRQSDHYSFAREGYKPVLFAFESGDAYDWAYHTSYDRWDCSLYNYTLAHRTIASIGAAVAFVLSRTQNQSVHERYTLSLQPGQNRTLLTVMTYESELDVIASWTSGPQLCFSVYDPDDIVLGSYLTPTDNGSGVEILSVEVGEVGLHSLKIENRGTSIAEVTVEFVYESDYEGNDIPDSHEYWMYDFAVDTDGDNITDGEEEFLGTDRFNADCDNDGLNDYEELNIYHTSPKWHDTDFDTMPDGWEVDNQLDPLHDDAYEDPDIDELLNLFEYRNGTLAYDNDTDDDLMPDGWEVMHHLNPLYDDAALDPDGDMITNLEEYRRGTDPHVSDATGGPPLSVDVLVVAGAVLMPVAITAYFFRLARRPSGA